MKPCARLHEYLDGQMSVNGDAAFRRHLDECEKCRLAVENWNALRLELNKIVEAVPVRHPQQQFAQKLLAHARSESPSRRLEFAWLKLGAAAAVGAVALLVVNMVMRAPEVKSIQHAPGVSEISPATNPLFKMTAKLIREKDIVPFPVASSTEKVLRVPRDSRLFVELGRDRIGLAGDSEAEVVEIGEHRIAIRLRRGRISCAVSKRSAGSDFVVYTGDATVRVIGTQFGITLHSDDVVEVTVAEGIVRVSDSVGKAWLVKSDETLRTDFSDELKTRRADESSLKGVEQLLEEGVIPSRSERESRGELDDKLEQPIDPPTLPKQDGKVRATSKSGRPKERAGLPEASEPSSVEESTELAEDWQQWIIDGRYDVAEQKLTSYLQNRPSDWRVWSLLADCQRKSKQWSKSILTYEKIAEQSPNPHESTRAIFMMGVIYQDKLGQHFDAIASFQKYMEIEAGKRPLRGAAMLRLARAYVSINEREKARPLLEKVIDEQTGTVLAKKAKQLLEQISK